MSSIYFLDEMECLESNLTGNRAILPVSVHLWHPRRQEWWRFFSTNWPMIEARIHRFFNPLSDFNYLTESASPYRLSWIYLAFQPDIYGNHPFNRQLTWLRALHRFIEENHLPKGFIFQAEHLMAEEMVMRFRRELEKAK